MDGDRPRRVLTELRAFLAAEPAPPEDPRQRVISTASLPGARPDAPGQDGLE
jgi:hypothetical protein